jgi:hypothetical protein
MRRNVRGRKSGGGVRKRRDFLFDSGDFPQNKWLTQAKGIE